MKTSRKGSSQGFRSLGNQREADRVASDEVEGSIYAKVMAHLGNGFVRVYFENEKRKGVEGVALIRGLLRRKGKVPIQTNDLVCIVPLSSDITKERAFQLWCVFTPKQAMELKECGKIPDYYTQSVASDEFVRKDPVEGFDFDYADPSAEEYKNAIDAI